MCCFYPTPLCFWFPNQRLSCLGQTPSNLPLLLGPLRSAQVRPNAGLVAPARPLCLPRARGTRASFSLAVPPRLPFQVPHLEPVISFGPLLLSRGLPICQPHGSLTLLDCFLFQLLVPGPIVELRGSRDLEDIPHRLLPRQALQDDSEGVKVGTWAEFDTPAGEDISAVLSAIL